MNEHKSTSSTPHGQIEAHEERKIVNFADIVAEHLIDELAESGPWRDYAQEIDEIKELADKLAKVERTDDEIARILHTVRRSILTRYSEAHPVPFRDYVLDGNRQRYGDQLGPSFDRLRRKFCDDKKAIITAVTAPVPNFAKQTAPCFKAWLIRRLIRALVREKERIDYRKPEPPDPIPELRALMPVTHMDAGGRPLSLIEQIEQLGKARPSRRKLRYGRKTYTES
ncbi:MAG: hypothetical protein U9N14_02030 [Pseudomonadota bacterium]|nr:hypothetical protein [Pseudomonadota bacterium]